MKNTEILLMFAIVCMTAISCKNNRGTSTVETGRAPSLQADCHDEFVKTIGAYSFTELGLACHDGDLSAVKKLIGEGACKSRCMSDEIYEYDVLYAAVTFGKTDLVKYFVDAGEDVNRTYDENGTTPLTLACQYDRPDVAFDMAKILLDVGADVDGGSDPGDEYEYNVVYPLFETVKAGNTKLFQLLIDKGVTFYPADNARETTIWAMAGENHETERILTEWQLRRNRSIGNRWVGSYGLDAKSMDDDTYAYEITIAKDSCTFLGAGVQLYFLDLCTAATDGDKLHLFYLKDLDGTSFGYHAKQDTLATIIRKGDKYYVTSPVISNEGEYDVELPAEKK